MTDPPGAPGTVAVIGIGYVGLTTAVCLASLGHRVVAVDVDEAKIAALLAGRMPILEEGLAGLIEAGLDPGDCPSRPTPRPRLAVPILSSCASRPPKAPTARPT